MVSSSSSTIDGQQVIIDIDDLPPDHATTSTSKTGDGNNGLLQSVKESLLAIFQLLYNCKLATTDNFLRERCRDINILDGSFYINTLQSLKYNDHLISLADGVINYTDNLRAPPLNVGQLLHLMSIPKGLLKESREKRELVVGVIRNYEDSQRSLTKVRESIRKHKKDLTRRRETMPNREFQYKKYKEISESYSEKSKKCIYIGIGIVVCNAYYIIIIICEGHLKFLFSFSIVFVTILSLAVLLIGYVFRLDSGEFSRNSEDVKASLEETRKLIAGTNDTDIRAIEHNVISLTQKVPIVLEYWNCYKESLEELSAVFDAGGHNFDPSQMGDKWREIKNTCEGYGQIVRDILEQNDLLNGRDSKN